MVNAMSKRWAIVKNNLAEGIIPNGNDLASAYPDVAHLLEEVPPQVQCNWRKIANVWTAPGAEPGRLIDTDEFLGRFTPAEFNAIMANNTARNFVIRRVLPRPVIDLDTAGTSTYLDSLVTAGFITAARKLELLAP